MSTSLDEWPARCADLRILDSDALAGQWWGWYVAHVSAKHPDKCQCTERRNTKFIKSLSIVKMAYVTAGQR
ncbi:MAG TPA: hypothetical protein VFV66_06495, partial [Nonomuraea sp.]|nr:hypothetical protein [Nonomuraea sp.]